MLNFPFKINKYVKHNMYLSNIYMHCHIDNSELKCCLYLFSVPGVVPERF